MRENTAQAIAKMIALLHDNNLGYLGIKIETDCIGITTIAIRGLRDDDLQLLESTDGD
jgi:hypothetical protein